MTGSGTQANPFKVTTMSDFVTAIESNSAYVELASDIDAKDWVPTANHQYILACNQIDGKGYAIKNLHADSSQYSIGIMFRLSSYNTTGVMKNLHWLNVYLNGVTFFITANSSGYGWAITDCTFQMELNNGRFLQQDYTGSTFTHCGICLYAVGDSTDVMTGSDASSACTFDTCSLEITGTCNYKIFTGQLFNSHLTGEITILNPNSSGGNLAPITVFNQGDYRYAASVIDMTVHCSQTWHCWASNTFALASLVVNMDHLEHCELQGATNQFISATTTQMNNATWLQNQDFDVSTASVGFVWHDWLINNGNTRVTQVDYAGHGTTFPFIVDGTTNQLIVNFDAVTPNAYWSTQPYTETQNGTYYFNATSLHRYKITIQSAMEIGMVPGAVFWRNGTEWGASASWSAATQSETYSAVFQAPDNTVRLSLQLQGVNRSNFTIAGSSAINNVTIIRYSDWVVVDGKLINQGVPEVPIMGSFCNDVNLSHIDIPASVKYIGPYAFSKTLLTHVKIASDCTYFSTSFPDGCIIENW